MNNSLEECLAYDDVLLKPQYSDIVSRNDVDASVMVDNHKLAVPIISSPMDTVTEAKMAIAMACAGGLGIIHRGCTIDNQVKMIDEIHKYRDTHNTPIKIAAAVGATGDFLERAIALCNKGCEIICIDVAHGHHINVQNAIKILRKELGDAVHIMAGSVATLEGFYYLANVGVNSIRVCIGSGAACTTRIKTGHGLPALSSIFECAQSTSDALLIADGGIRTSGDIVKALAAGADLVMLGSLLAGCDEAPGEFRLDDKQYRGMASKNAQIDRNTEPTYVEGVGGYIRRCGSVKHTIEKLKAGIASGMSYSGARTLSELRTKARFVRQTNAGVIEGHSHLNE